MTDKALNGKADHVAPALVTLPEPKKTTPIAWAKGGKTRVGEKQELLHVAVAKLCGGWNSRKTGDVEADKALVDDMRARRARGQEPVIQPIKIAKLASGQYQVVVGNRRTWALHQLDQKATIPATLLDVPANATPEEVDAWAREENITENLHRSNLLPWEVAEACFDYVERHPEVPLAALAARIGKSRSHVENMIRVRKKLCPELWQAYQQKGDAMRWKDLAKVCVMPPEEQVAAYNELVKEQKGGRPEGKKDGVKRPSGGESGGYEDADEEPENPLPVDATTADKWLVSVKKLPEGTSREKLAFYAGAFHALQAVTGAVRRFEPASEYKIFKDNADEEESETP